MLLKDQTIIITGASSGIGKAAAHLFAAHGANVVLGARREGLLEEIAADIKDAGGHAIWRAGDVGQEKAALDLVAAAKQEFGNLTGAFNNAGVMGVMGPVEQMTTANWNEVITTNLTSAYFAAKHQIPAIRESGRGSLVFTSSFVGHTTGFPGMSAYGAAKAGLVGFARGLAVEHGSEDIRVNTLLPGGTETAMAGDDPDQLNFIKGLHALKRMATPDEIAQTAMFLLSDAASFVTGTALLADGGNSINKI